MSLFVLIFSVVLFFTLSVAGPISDKTDFLLESNSLNVDENVMTRIAVVNEENDLDLFESDIVLRKHNRHTVTKRNARRSRKFLWRDKKVPYVIAQELINSWYKPTITKAFEEFHRYTCVRFVPRTTEKNWLKFVKKIRLLVFSW